MTFSTLLIGAACAVALLAGASQLLPRNVHVTRSATVQAAPDQILNILASNAGFQTINPYKTTDPDLKITLFGPDHGVGSGFRFDGRDGKGTQTVSALSATSVTYAIDLGAMGQPTQHVHVTPAPDGTLVRWDMHADMGRNPIARGFGLFMDRIMGKTLEQGLANLNATS